jgi:hypothetical protein
LGESTVLPSSNPVGKIGSRYSTNILLLAFYTKTKDGMAQSCGMMFIDLLDGCCYGDQNTCNTFPVSEQKITLE